MSEHLSRAKVYVDEQLDIMQKYGKAPKLSRKRYDALIAKVARTTKRLFT
jgi:hypothetical protein